MKNSKLAAIFVSALLIVFFLFYLLTNSSNDRISPLGEMIIPEDNLMSDEKIELGRKLFFDKRLSIDNSTSCSSCHLPELAFTDGKNRAIGVEGRVAERNAPSLLNAGYLKAVMFDAEIPNLELQVSVPIQEHTEMDMPVGKLIAKLNKVEEYRNAAMKIFNREFDAWVLTRSIAAFERSLISDNSRFDQYYYNKNKEALSDSELNGWKIFSNKLYCTECHPAPFFTTFNAECNGLYEDYGTDKGRFRIDHDTLDMGKFKIPSLRNIELTGPYMHDGSMITIDQVIEHYASGGKSHRSKSKIIKSFTLSKSEKADLKAFLNSLTDTSYLVQYQ